MRKEGSRDRLNDSKISCVCVCVCLCACVGKFGESAFLLLHTIPTSSLNKVHVL